MFKDILDRINSGMEKSIIHAINELKKIRTGRANPEIFDSIYIDYYGTQTALNQLSTINTPEARVINIVPYEKNLIPLIEKAILNSNMGFTPNNNGTSIIIPIPALSQERRKELIKFVHQLIEEGKISVRNIRREGNQNLFSFGKEKNISEDLIKDNEAKIQIMTDNFIKRLDQIQKDKEKEILEI